MPVYSSNYREPGTLRHRPGRPPAAVGFSTSPGSAKMDGVALPTGPDERGRQLWKLVVGKQELHGRYVLTDGLFTPA